MTPHQIQQIATYYSEHNLIQFARETHDLYTSMGRQPPIYLVFILKGVAQPDHISEGRALAKEICIRNLSKGDIRPEYKAIAIKLGIIKLYEQPANAIQRGYNAGVQADSVKQAMVKGATEQAKAIAPEIGRGILGFIKKSLFR